MARLRKMTDDGPLVVREEDVEDGAVAVCRCGLSDGWPYCDGSHRATEGEDDDAVYRYHRNGDLERSQVGGDLAEALDEANSG